MNTVGSLKCPVDGETCRIAYTVYHEGSKKLVMVASCTCCARNGRPPAVYGKVHIDEGAVRCMYKHGIIMAA